MQFDTKNNDSALKCLSECGFSTFEIQSIVNQTCTATELNSFNKRLVLHYDVIARYDEAQLQHCLAHVAKFTTNNSIPIKDIAGQMALADYVNQYGSLGEHSRDFYRRLKRAITNDDVLYFKSNFTEYGRKHKDDCKRRYLGVIKACKEV